MVTNLVILTPEQLAELISQSVKNALAEQAAPQSRPHAAHEYLNMAEASKYLQLPQNTLYAYCHERRIPYTKRGKRNFFLRADLDLWLESDRKKSVREIELETMEKLKKGARRI